MKISSSILNLVEIACRGDASVLIMGPTGSGKTAIARYIHDRTARSTRPFVHVNLATLHEGTLEAELFGVEKGAFTGAEKRIGRLEAANGGTVFLDEIAELPLRLQARLLEFIQSKTIIPMGSNRQIKLDVRIIAATNKNLLGAVAAGEFREDLFFRLRVIAFSLQRLADREDEFDEIVHDCLADICSSLNRSVLRISEDFALHLENYQWPGNIRELRNVLEFAVQSSTSGALNASNLPEWFLNKETILNMAASSAGLFDMAYERAVSEFEKAYLQNALRRSRGRINRTARKIGMNKTTLIRRIRAYDLMKPYLVCAEAGFVPSEKRP